MRFFDFSGDSHPGKLVGRCLEKALNNFSIFKTDLIKIKKIKCLKTS